MSIELTPIATIRTPYQEKFAIPRQPGLVTEAQGQIEMQPEFADINGFRGIEQFSHLWLVFQFHQTVDKGWSPLVRPPRMGGNEKIGVFATRSTFRPNGLGLSVVEFVRIERKGAKLNLVVRGPDLLDGTPILDIKPYLPYADALPEAKGGFAAGAPESLMASTFSPQAETVLTMKSAQHPKLRTLIEQVLGQDPRPAYQAQDTSERVYGVRLYDMNIRWQVVDGVNQILDIQIGHKNS